MSARSLCLVLGLAIASLAPTGAGAVELPWSGHKVEAGDARAVAAAQIGVIRLHLPPAASTVVVQALDPRDTSQRAYADALEKALRAAGYAVAADQQIAHGAHPVRMAVRSLGGGFVLELSLNGQNRLQYFQWDGGQLRAAGPVTIREGS